MGLGLMAAAFSWYWECAATVKQYSRCVPTLTPYGLSVYRLSQEKSTNGIFDGVVAAADGLFVKAIAPTALDTLNVLSYYSGSKSGYGINVQAMCTADYRFCSMSAIASGATNDWAAWNRSCMSRAVSRLPSSFYILGDAAYPLSEKILTPYPGKGLPNGKDSFNFHLSQLRVKIEQSFGILVSQWGILWRPLKVRFDGRADLLTALFHLHNFLRDEQVTQVATEEEDKAYNGERPVLTGEDTLPAEWQPEAPAPSRSGESSARAALRMKLEAGNQWRPVYNMERNSDMALGVGAGAEI